MVTALMAFEERTLQHLQQNLLKLHPMITETISPVSNISAEHSSWLRGVDFYQDEINIMRKRLTEVSSKNTAREVKKHVEQFQNQFKVHEEQLHKLKHAVSGHAKNIDSDMIAHHGQLERATAAEHDIMRDDYVNTEKLFNEMRHDFNRFLSKYM
jgi:conjugal transfer/entry exclusion protein